MNELTTIKFHGADLATTNKDGKILVAMKPIAEHLGLDWSGQLKRIKRIPTLKRAMDIMSIPTTDGGNQEIITLPIEFLNGWLMGVSINHVKPEIKDRLMEYQDECYQALHDYFFKGVAINDRRIAELEEVNSGLTERVQILKTELDNTIDGFERSYYKALDGKKELHDKVADLEKQVDRLQYENGALELKIIEQNEIPEWLLKDHVRKRAQTLAQNAKVDVKTVHIRIYEYLKNHHNFNVMEESEYYSSKLDAIEARGFLPVVKKFLDRQGVA